MIQAEQFVEAARKRGFQWYAGVPCSFLTPFINYVINDDSLSYIASSNEGDALATAAGATIAGNHAVVMMQNSGLGNAVNPITSLAYVFRIPVLIICTLRGDPSLKDEPQHELMGQVTDRLFETMSVPWEYFPSQASEIEPVLQRASEYMHHERRPYALIMRKGTVAPCALNKDQFAETKALHLDKIFTGPLTPRLSRNQALRRIVELTDPRDSVIIATTGYTGRELFAIADRDNHLYMVGSMGCASSLALGLSLARPELRVVVIDGDGAALMRMGNLTTIGAYGGSNLVHVLLDNEVHESTGGQATVSAGVSFSHIAAACGYGRVMAGNELSTLDELLAHNPDQKPSFAHLKTVTGVPENLPRPDLTPEAVLKRFMNHIETLR
jgi:phosphonopyruvate decarboxylase